MNCVGEKRERLQLLGHAERWFMRKESPIFPALVVSFARGHPTAKEWPPGSLAAASTLSPPYPRRCARTDFGLARQKPSRYTNPYAARAAHRCGHRQVVRHQLPKLTSAGSSPVARSSKTAGRRHKSFRPAFLPACVLPRFAIGREARRFGEPTRTLGEPRRTMANSANR